jgi:DNA-binding Lrp family transcriptional regulator
MADLDAIDRRMLNLLRIDGRASNARLAAEVGLSPSACLRRLKTLERNGTIRGYAALVADSAEDERRGVVIVQIAIERQTAEAMNRFEAAVKKCPDVLECYLMAGTSDYLLRVEVLNAGDYERIHAEQLSRLPGVTRIQSNFALRRVVRPRPRPAA